MAPALPRPTRATRGKRLSKLLDEEIEADEEFWNQDAFKEDVADDEYEEEQELADEFDSDFNDDEDESGDEEVEEKERRPKKKQILPPGGKKPLKKGPSGSTKKKGVSFLEEAAAAADAGETPLPTLKTPRQATRPSPEKEDGETEEGEKLLRKSTRTSVIVRQAEREAQRAIQQALPKIVKKKREGEDRKMTQEEMLLEAAQTEIQNRQSLETLLAREEEVKRKAIINKEVYSGPLIRFYSKEGINVLEFVKMPEVPEVINAKAPPYPKQPVCVVTGLLAKYRDPKSGFPYATKEAFAIIRERQRKGEDISRKDSLEKVQRKRTKVEREKFAPGTRTGAVKIKYKKPDKPVETKFQNSPKPQSQPSVENRASGGAGPSGATSSGLGTLDKPENSNKVGEFEDKLDHTSTPAPAPGLFPTLLQKLQIPDVLATQRIYLVLNQTLKELSTKRLAADQRNFAEVTAQYFEYTWHHWCTDTQVILQGLQSLVSDPQSLIIVSDQDQVFQLTCERWMLCLKVLRRMLIHGFQNDAKSVQEVGPVKDVCPPFLQAVQELLKYRTALKHGQVLHAFVDKACLKLMKIFVEVQSTHPYSFSNRVVLPSVLEFCYIQITEVKEDNVPFEPFLIKCMIFVQSVIQCGAYRPNKTGRVVGQSTTTMEETKANLARQAEEIVMSLLNKQRLVVLCEILVRRYFVLTPADLEEWAQDPELFHHEQDLVQYKEKIRPCAESLYLSLFECHRELLAPVVVGILKQASEACPAVAGADVQITPALLLKETAYNAVGAAYYDLHDYIDFKSWWEGALVHEMSNLHPNGRILSRRIAWLLGKWVNKIKGELRKPVYSALIILLGHGDLAVQLAACHSLQNLIDDVHFYEEEFLEYVPTCLGLLIQFMQNAQEFDSKLQIFNLVSLIIDRLGGKIVPCVDKILAFLPQVWQDSEGQSLLQIQVMLALSRLLVALGPRSSICYDILFPILQCSTDVNQPDELNMLEDGMQLWETTLRNAAVMVPPLMNLFPHLVAVMERNFDHLQAAMNIIQSYILLGGANFVRSNASGVVKIFDVVVGNVKEKGMLYTLPVIDSLIQCFPVDAPPLLEGILQKLFVMVASGRDDADLVKASAGAVLARVFVQNNAFFAQFTSQPSLFLALQQSGMVVSDQIPLFLFFDAWLDKVDSLTSMLKRKLCALALCILLTVSQPQVLDRLEQILSVCTSVLHETAEENNASASSYDYSSVEDGSMGSVESEESRKRQVISADPIVKVPLAPFLKEKLQTCAQVHGNAAFNMTMAKLHPTLLDQLQKLMQS